MTDNCQKTEVEEKFDVAAIVLGSKIFFIQNV